MNKRSGTRDSKAAPKKSAAASPRRSGASSSRAVRKNHAASDADPKPVVDGAVRRAMVAQAAYFRAEQRGFAPGHALEDWAAAEREIERMLGH